MSGIKTWVCGICKAEWKGDDESDCPACSSLAPVSVLEPATRKQPTMKHQETPRTLRCWRDGHWHADELANLSANLERENAELQETVNTLHNLCVSAEKRCMQKLKEEAAAAGSNDKVQP